MPKWCSAFGADEKVSPCYLAFKVSLVCVVPDCPAFILCQHNAGWFLFVVFDIGDLQGLLYFGQAAVA